MLMPLYILLFSILLLIYFRVAQRYNIIDRPNHRSSHSKITIRGAGIVFPVAILVSFAFSGFSYPYFAAGLFSIAAVSFYDDIKPLPNSLRLSIHLLSVTLLFIDLSVFSQPFLLVILLYIMLIGIVNAYNFMDGINGITAFYSMIAMAALYWISVNVSFLQEPVFFRMELAALIAFSFFNFRKSAKCFAGDVGSISMAFSICFLLTQLTIVTRWPFWVLLLGVYGIDALFTIACRLIRKESLMLAHRSHFYQYLANEAKMNHVQVSLIYGTIQVFLDLVVIYSYLHGTIWPALAALLVILGIYVIFRFRLEGKSRLLVAY